MDACHAAGILPIDAAADGIGGPTVGEVLTILPNRHRSQAPGGFGGLTTGGEEGGKLVISDNGAERIAHPQVYIVARESRMRDASCLLRDGGNGVRVEGHQWSPGHTVLGTVCSGAYTIYGARRRTNLPA